MFMRLLTSCLALFMMSGNALASGGLSCDSEEDAPARILIEAGMTRGMGSPLFSVKGSVTIADASVAEDLRRMEFGQQHVPQYWLDMTSLKLRLYREREGDKPHGYVDITIHTQPRDDEEGTYGGGYTLEVFDMTGDTTGEGKTVKLEGPMSCFVE
jgi:hypothetical protein